MILTELPTEFIEIFQDVLGVVPLLSIPGVYLAGGFLRTLMSPDEEIYNTDVDFFFRDGGALEEAKIFLDKTPYTKSYQCPENKLATYKWMSNSGQETKIQLVSVDFYDTLSQLVDSFDFTVTMFATDGEVFIQGNTALQDTLDKHLVWNKITYPASSLRRMMKYARKGYWMREEDYQEFVSKVWEHDGWITDEKLVYVD